MRSYSANGYISLIPRLKNYSASCIVQIVQITMWSRKLIETERKMRPDSRRREKTSFSATKVGYESHNLIGRLRLTRAVKVVKGSKRSGNEGDGEDGGPYRHRFHLPHHVATRIDMFKLILASHPCSTLFLPQELPLHKFSYRKIFNTKKRSISSSSRYPS